MKTIKVLFIASSDDKFGDTSNRTGVWLEELAAPYYVFTDMGFALTIASPNGGPVPLDPKSESIMMATQTTKRFLKDEVAMSFIADSTQLEDVKASDFDAVFLPGGHGTLWDIADNIIVKQLLEAFDSEKKPIGAVGHGVVGLLLLENDNGELLIKGKQLTGFSNSEEQSTGLDKVASFLVETKLVSVGALYSKRDNYLSHVVIDDNIITGQNPASSDGVAKKMAVLLPLPKEKAIVKSVVL